MASVIRLDEIRTRPPEHGRIRLGERFQTRNGKTAMRATTTFRFTSHDRTAIEQLAELYGGTPGPWSDPKAPEGQWEVLTTSNRISVWLPPNAYNVAYERWGGRGVERRCDGARCTSYGFTNVESGCLCALEEERSCKTTSRVQLILPEIKLGGVWRLESKSENFAYEAPGMIDMLSAFQAQGMTKVDVVLVQRTTTVQGQKKNFIVPVFEAQASPMQVLEGAAQVRPAGVLQHPSGQAPALALVAAPDDEVVDAEIMDEDWHQSLYVVEKPEEDDLAARLEASVQMVEARKAEEELGWDVPPPGVSVKRNPDPNGRKWVRR